MGEHFGCPPHHLYHVSIGELVAWNRRASGDHDRDARARNAWRVIRRAQAEGASPEEIARLLAGAT